MSAEKLYAKYGSFEFEPHEATVSFSARSIKSTRNFRQYIENTLTYHVDLCQHSAENVTTRLNEINTAFSVNYQDAGLFHEDGSPTFHFLENDSAYNLTGNQVDASQFPKTENGEYSTGRQFQLVVTSLWLASDSELLEHYDSMRRIGNAGPEFRLNMDQRGCWFERESPATFQEIIHSGYRIGATTWPTPITPYYPIPFERNTERIIYHESPKVYPNGYCEYKVSWQYKYVLPGWDDISRPRTS